MQQWRPSRAKNKIKRKKKSQEQYWGPSRRLQQAGHRTGCRLRSSAQAPGCALLRLLLPVTGQQPDVQGRRVSFHFSEMEEPEVLQRASLQAQGVLTRTAQRARGHSPPCSGRVEHGCVTAAACLWSWATDNPVCSWQAANLPRKNSVPLNWLSPSPWFNSGQMAQLISNQISDLHLTVKYA